MAESRARTRGGPGALNGRRRRRRRHTTSTSRRAWSPKPMPKTKNLRRFMNSAVPAAPDALEVRAHQFQDIEQQHHASWLGMWVFLATEVMFFGGMFAGYAYYRVGYSDAFAAGSNRLDVLLGAINTAVLIGSSFTMALAVHSGQMGRNKAAIRFLLLKMLLGAVFSGF